MRTIFYVLIVAFSLSACGKNEADSTATDETRGTKNIPIVSSETLAEAQKAADALGQNSMQENDFVVDEPLPPFDEGMDGIPVLEFEAVFQGVAPAEASGRLLLYRLPDGSRLLRLEELRVTSAPGLQLQFAKAAAPQTFADAGGGFSVGVLKGSSGNQNYLIEKTRSVAGLLSLVIVSQEPAAVFATARLIAAK